MPKFRIKYLLLAVFFISLLILAGLVLLGYHSQKQPPKTQPQEKLAFCASSLNCVCSECPQAGAHYVEAIELPEKRPMPDLDKAVEVVTAMGGEITLQTPGYIAATFKSRLFGFVDDFELRLDHEAHRLHIRSASRVGISDMGENKRRVQRFRKEFLARF